MTRPAIILLMGASGSGKTTLGQALARELGWHFADADDFHFPANIAKMQAGHPLDDSDRAPWLAALRHHLAQSLAEARPTVLACSALKKGYRQRLLCGLPPHAVHLVYLRGSRDLLATRLAARTNHFMPAALLDSQLDALEEPGPEENALVLDIAPPPAELVSQMLKALRAPNALSHRPPPTT